MNGYTLTKRWYEFKFENIKRVRSVHSDLFFYIVYLWNELGQVEEFGLPTTFTMQALGIGSYNTYKKALQDLVEFGFILIISEAKNQHQSKVIAISNIDEATDKASDKPLKRAVNNTTAKATDYIKRTTNNKLNKEQKRERFTPPKLHEIEQLIMNKNYQNVNPDKFFNHYESNGWMVGKNKMKNWQAALRKWNADDINNSKFKKYKNEQNERDEPRVNGQTITSATKNSLGFG